MIVATEVLPGIVPVVVAMGVKSVPMVVVAIVVRNDVAVVNGDTVPIPVGMILCKGGACCGQEYAHGQ